MTGRGTVLLAAGGQRLHRSVDQGVSWTPTVVPEPIWPSVETGAGLFAIGLEIPGDPPTMDSRGRLRIMLPV